MSASDRLKSLDPASAPAMYATQNAIDRGRILTRALPQIVAVVEAAENQWRGNEDDEKALDAALTALEEALGGDVT